MLFIHEWLEYVAALEMVNYLDWTVSLHRCSVVENVYALSKHLFITITVNESRFIMHWATNTASCSFGPVCYFLINPIVYCRIVATTATDRGRLVHENHKWISISIPFSLYLVTHTELEYDTYSTSHGISYLKNQDWFYFDPLEHRSNIDFM